MATVPRNFFHSKLFPVISSAHLHFWEISCHFLFDLIMCCNCHLLRFPFRPTPCHVDRLHLWLPFATLKLWRQYHPFSNRRFWQQNVQPFRRKAGRGGQEIGSFFLIRWNKYIVNARHLLACNTALRNALLLPPTLRNALLWRYVTRYFYLQRYVTRYSNVT